MLRRLVDPSVARMVACRSDGNVQPAETTLLGTMKKKAFFYPGELVVFDSGVMICNSLDHARIISSTESHFHDENLALQIVNFDPHTNIMAFECFLEI